jgi:hypothetical protein
VRVRYLENPYTGRYIRLPQEFLADNSNDDWLWEKGLAGFYLHEFEESSPDHTLFILRHSDRIRYMQASGIVAND